MTIGALAVVIAGTLAGMALGWIGRSLVLGRSRSGGLSRGWGGVALIPGNGWQAAVWRYGAADDRSSRPGVGPIRSVERMPVIGWELHQPIDGANRGRGGSVFAQVDRAELRAHCIDADQLGTTAIEPGDPLLIQFLAPGEEVADAELIRRQDAHQEPSFVIEGNFRRAA